MPGACVDPDAAEGKYIQKVLNRTRRDEQDADGCWLVDLCVDCKFDVLKSRKEIDRCRRQHEGPNWYTVVFPACGDCMVEYTTVAKRGDQTTKHVVWIKSRHPDTGLYTVQDADPPTRSMSAWPWSIISPGVTSRSTAAADWSRRGLAASSG
ncbi:hypothetical protein CYMTET_37857 [Cymbomonas tetramitiformis]|uniref:Uncharacterized protein n=1 Tax=Cymbomonas tetramitiformis TaxID=36881 RepID=A0AAE0CD39_9CHLO|nr:hypothetical protein CYMTET_37857 [Cymbomonas tetramitiformis]